MLTPDVLAGLGITDFDSYVSNAACEAAAIASATHDELRRGRKYCTFDGVHRDLTVNAGMMRYALAQLPRAVPEPGVLDPLLVGGGGLLPSWHLYGIRCC